MYGGDTRSYADSLENPDGTKVFQRHWIGVTPMDAILARRHRPPEPLASRRHGRAALREREQACYTNELGLWHTGTGPTSAEGGNPGPSCDSVVSKVPSERNAFSLNTGIMAVAEGNFGRLGVDQQQHYTTANARIQRVRHAVAGGCPAVGCRITSGTRDPRIGRQHEPGSREPAASTRAVSAARRSARMVRTDGRTRPTAEKLPLPATTGRASPACATIAVSTLRMCRSPEHEANDVSRFQHHTVDVGV